MIYQLTRTGYNVEFYNRPGDSKLSFRILGNAELNRYVLDRVKTKRISRGKESYVLAALDNLITAPKTIDANNPLIVRELSELIQLRYGQPLMKSEPVVLRRGEVRAGFILPDGRIFETVNINQRLARQGAAKEILKTLEI